MAAIEVDARQVRPESFDNASEELANDVQKPEKVLGLSENFGVMKKGPIYEIFGIFSKFFRMMHSMCASDLTTIFMIVGDAKVNVTPFQGENEAFCIVGGSRWCLKFIRKIFAWISGSYVGYSYKTFRGSGVQLGFFLASRKVCVEKIAMDVGYLEFLDRLELYAEPLGAMPACGVSTAVLKALVMLDGGH